MSRLTMRLLGQVSVQQGDTLLTGLPSRKAEALLIYLACTRRPAAREVLADLLWDDRPHEQALANLRTLLTSLRRALGAALLIARDTIAFNRESDYWLDVEAFETHLAARPASIPDEASPDPLLSATELYQGDFLAGFYLRESRGFEEWAALERERLHRLAVLALRQLTQQALERGDDTAGQDFAARWVRFDSLSEEAHRALMLSLARGGQRPAALAQYEVCRRTLADELGVAPTEETTALYAHLRSAHTFGTHNLPPPMTEFVGREMEVRELTTQLARPTSRLITLLGPGGMGKTRLAVETARRMVEERPGAFLHGVRFASLAGQPSPHFLTSTLVEALEVPGSDEPRDRLLNYLRDREMLLVLDNFEHLLGDNPASVDLLAELLTHAPMVKLLITSRERLNLREEEVFDVGGLRVPAYDEALADQHSAIKLFVTEARRARREFIPSAPDTLAIVKLCRALEGAPLGIELAAASIRQQTCGEIAAALERNLDTLTTALRNVPERHRSLRAAFEHSWGLLTHNAQAHLARLSIFPDTFTGEAAGLATVSVADLSLLVDKSLLQRRADGRYQIHPLLRQYAAEKLSEWPEVQSAMRQAHCDFYANELDQQSAWLKAGRPQQVVQAIGAELGNVRAAWAYAITQRQRQEIGQMLDGLRHFYVARGWLNEGRETLQNAIEALAGEAEAEVVLMARLEVGRAECELWLSNFETAQVLLASSTTILSEHNAWPPLAWAYDLWGTLMYQQGNFAEARQHSQKSLALFRQLDDQAGMAQVLNNLANMLCDESAAYDEADDLYEESLAIYQQLGDAFGQAKCLINLGSTAQMRSEYDRAREFYQQGIDLCRTSDNRPTLAIALTNLGQLLSTLGQQAEAERWLLESLTLKREFGQRRSLVFSLKRLGTVATRLGQYPQAKDYYDEALRLSRQLSSPTLAADVLIGVAGLLSVRGHTQQAVEVLAAVQRHAANDQEIVNEAAERLAEISGALAPEIVAAGRTRGEARDLDEVIIEMLRMGNA